MPQPHPGGVIVYHHQCKLMAFVNLVFCPHEHLNHLLGDIESVGFGAGEGQRMRGGWLRRGLQAWGPGLSPHPSIPGNLPPALQ